MTELAAMIAGALNRELPGTDIQWEMASSDRMGADFPRIKKEDSRLAAVLILLYPSGDSICTMLMQRPLYNGVHSGQISFPGGKAEPGDASLTDTALREAFEETGINISAVTVLGRLTPLYIHVSDTEVTPVVAWYPGVPAVNINRDEVVKLIELRLPCLNDAGIIKEKPFKIRKQMLKVRYYDYRGHVIWGATAMLLHELMTILRRDSIPLDI